MARVDGQLLAGNVEGPIPIHIHVLIGDQHDAVEVEREDADCQIEHRTNRRYVSGDVLDHADQQRGQQVVERETHRHALLVDMCAPGHPLSHALVVFPHWRTYVIGIAGRAHEFNLGQPPGSGATSIRNDACRCWHYPRTSGFDGTSQRYLNRSGDGYGAGCSNTLARHLSDHYVLLARCDPSTTAPTVPEVDRQLARAPRRPS